MVVGSAETGDLEFHRGPDERRDRAERCLCGSQQGSKVLDLFHNIECHREEDGIADDFECGCGGGTDAGRCCSSCGGLRQNPLNRTVAEFQYSRLDGLRDAERSPRERGGRVGDLCQWLDLPVEGRRQFGEVIGRAGGRVALPR